MSAYQLPKWMAEIDLRTLPPSEHEDALAKLYGYWSGGELTDQQVFWLSAGRLSPAIERAKHTEIRDAQAKRGIDPNRNQAAVDVALTLLQAQKGRVTAAEASLKDTRDRLDELIHEAQRQGASSSEIAKSLGWTRQMVNLVLRGRPSRATGKPLGRPAKKSRLAR